MPKIKTHSGAKKRFKLSKNGKVIRAHAEYVVFQFDIPSLHCVVGRSPRYN